MSTIRPLDFLRNNRKGDFIPQGRQLPRTPPSQDCVRQLDCKSESPQPPAESKDEENQDPNDTSDAQTPPVKQGWSNDPESMLKGIGYQLTPADVQFMQSQMTDMELKKLQMQRGEDFRQWSMEVVELTRPAPDTKASRSKL